ncbi:stalk domain-containing protein [Paenibacillus gansuensis]|uniref:Stalk domain-containing protein n=1 Tax=Paenibacillus gansuensis TaxID=306542 RepID=A0ABW5PJ24_9BACL
MNKFLLGMITGVMLFVSTSAFASTSLQKVQAYINKQISVKVNGNSLAVEPILYNNTTYLPIRKIAEATNSQVNMKGKVIELNSISNEHKENQTSINDPSPSPTVPRFIKIPNYYKESQMDALKIDNRTYVHIADGARHYELFDRINYDKNKKVIAFDKSEVKIIVDDEYTSTSKAFLYQGVVYVDESSFGTIE